MTHPDRPSIPAVIDDLLAARRPDRFTPGVDDEWLDAVAVEIEPLIPEATAIQRHARMLVRERETSRTRTANQIFREMLAVEQLMLPVRDWPILLDLPISVGKEHVALRAATSADLRTSAADERRRAAKEFTSRNAACEAKEALADQMDANGWDFGRDIDVDQDDDDAA
jgi:hypothetical protein